MDYTLSNSYATDAATTQRMHLQAQAIPTAVSDADMNMVIWEAMEIVKAAGLVGAPFDKAVPATYQKLLTALRAAGVFITPGIFDNTTKVATSAFVKKAGSQYGAVVLVGGAATLAAQAHAGGLVTLGGTSYAVTLPDSATFPSGATLTFLCTATGVVTLNRAGTDTVAMGSGAAQTAIAMSGGDTLTLVSNGAGVWSAGGGSAQLRYAPAFASSLGSSGYKRMPDVNSPTGFFIEQWGPASVSVTADTVINYPVAFPSAILNLSVTGDYTPGSGVLAYYNAATTLASFTVRASGSVGARFRAIGY